MPGSAAVANTYAKIYKPAYNQSVSITSLIAPCAYRTDCPMSPTIINAPAPNLMVRETEEFASVIDSSINETKSHASVAGLYDSGTGVDEYETEADDSETQADDSETQADGNGTDADDNETQAKEYEIEADENDTDADNNETQTKEYETEAEENDTDADENGTKADEYVRYANKALTQSTFRQIAGSRASKKKRFPSRCRVAEGGLVDWGQANYR